MHDRADPITALASEPPASARLAPRHPLPANLRRRICCVIPCYNVGSLCAAVIDDVARHAGRVVVIDDGSTDDTPRRLRQAQARHPGQVTVITLATNRGKGVALIRGFRQALRHPECDVVVTCDGDGQHRPGDIPRLAAQCMAGADLVIAQRQFPRNMPRRSRVGNNLSAAILTSAFRHAPRDTQCGLRAHSRLLAEQMVQNLEGNRYDTESTILILCLRFGRPIAQTPIPAIYHGRNESSHYRPFTDSLRILWSFFMVVLFPRLGLSPIDHYRGLAASFRAADRLAAEATQPVSFVGSAAEPGAVAAAAG